MKPMKALIVALLVFALAAGVVWVVQGAEGDSTPTTDDANTTQSGGSQGNLSETPSATPTGDVTLPPELRHDEAACTVVGDTDKTCPDDAKR